MKVGIVGSGLVGSTAAYALVMRGVGSQIVLVDVNKKRARAEADDIMHAVPFANPLAVSAGEYSDLKGCRAVIIAAGVSQKPGESRLHLLARNAAIFGEIIPQILKNAPETILLIAANPVDITTHIAARIAAKHDVPKSRVFGSGTTLDTARFRTLLGNYLGVDAQHIHAYVVGEHGDSEVLTWSLAAVGGIPLQDYCQSQGISLDEKIRHGIDHSVRSAAYNIIEGKGATYYGIGSALARIVSAVVNNQRAILTVCTPKLEVAGVLNVTLSLPHLVGGSGILSTLPLPLKPNEEKALKESALLIKNVTDELDRQK